MTKFHIHDIVFCKVEGMKCNMAVVEVWNDRELPRLLVTDVEHSSMQTNPVLQIDCELVHRESEEPVMKVFERRKEVIKPILSYPIAKD